MKTAGWGEYHFTICALLLLSLTACGSGGGGSGGGDGGPAGPYTIGGTVTGLTGSGLVLKNAYPDELLATQRLPISANGPFTFRPAVADTGNDFVVVVETQPSSPSQTCVVTNGSGTIAMANVTNVSVVCTTTGALNANLNGTYKVVEYRYGGGIFEGQGDAADLFTLTFDGAGNFSGTDILNKTGGVVVSNPISGTYAIAADGTLTISRVGSSLIGSLSADGNTLVISQATSDKAPAVAVGIKQGPTNFANSDLAGSYTMVDYGYDGTGDIVHLDTVTFDGLGNVSGSDTQNKSGTISSQAYSATYAVAADGTLTLSPTGGSPMTGGLSADGNTLVISQMTSGNSPEVLVGIKRGLLPIGAYSTVRYGYQSTGDISAVYSLTFSGGTRGQYYTDGAINNAGTIGHYGDRGSYGVHLDGTVDLLSFSHHTSTGRVSADGNTLVTAQVTPQEAPYFSVGIR